MKKTLCVIFAMIFAFSMSLVISAEDSVNHEERINEIISNGTIVSVSDCEIEIVYEGDVLNNTRNLFNAPNGSVIQKEFSSCKIITNGEEETEKIYKKLSTSTRDASGTQTKDFEGGLAILYSTIYYSATDVNNLTYIWMTSATGGVTLLDNPTSVVGSLITFGQIGVTETGSFVQQIDEQNKGAVFSWTASPPSSFKKVLMEEMNKYTFVGCTYECTVRRGTADTTYLLSNAAFEMFGS